MQLAAAVRALIHRGGSTLVILVVAIVATAAATAGPAYFTAAKLSIARDVAASTPTIGYEATETGGVQGMQPQMTQSVLADVSTAVGGAAATRRLFAPPVASMEALVQNKQPGSQDLYVVWRAGACAQLQFVRGGCAIKIGQADVSKLAAAANGWHLHQRIRAAGFRPLTITGIYQVPHPYSSYWFDRSQTYFPQLDTGVQGRTTGSGSPYDALFTPLATMNLSATAQGTAVVDDQLLTRNLTISDIPRLQSAMNGLISSTELQNLQVILTSGIPASFSAVQSNWQSVAVPVFLITLQLLTLTWLLLFLTVTDAVQARDPEIALAKLRGHGRLRTLAFGLSEPLVLLLLALPLGIAAGWAATTVLAKLLLVPGTPVGLPWTAWAAAAAATAGGVAAVVAAGFRTLRQPLAQQWRHAARRAADRGWVIDAILLTGATAGLANLLLTGKVSSAGHSVLSLLVPGLLGLAVAVAVSRLLPIACRAIFPLGGKRSQFGLYLAVRQIARRPGAVRTTIVLATAFALASFAVTAWSVGRDNYQLVAGADVGAPVVLTVSAPPGQDLGTIVDHADPGGKLAVAVDDYTSFSSGNTSGVSTLAVDPQRFARVANWRSSYAAQPLRTLMTKLDPAAPAATVTLNGTAFRIRMQVGYLSLPGEQFSADVTHGKSPVTFGTVPAKGTITYTGQLVGCPCILQDLRLSESGVQIEKASQPKYVSGRLTMISMAERIGRRWHPVAVSQLNAAHAWVAGQQDQPPDDITASAAGIGWAFTTQGGNDQILDAADRPIPLPALAAASLVGSGNGTYQGVGLDGNTLALSPVIPVAAIPGAPSYGFIVDRKYAELAAGQGLSQIRQQVWLAAGAQSVIEPRLRAAGVRVTAVATSAAAARALERQGPALVDILFLADAMAAVLIASGAAILGLYLSARRRRYEYAALAATGVKRRTLRNAVLIELTIVLGFGAIVGLGTGLAGAAFALRNVPEFVSQPAAPPLSYTPPPVLLILLLGSALVLLTLTAVGASIALIRGVRMEQLREAPA